MTKQCGYNYGMLHVILGLDIKKHMKQIVFFRVEKVNDVNDEEQKISNKIRDEYFKVETGNKIFEFIEVILGIVVFGLLIVGFYILKDAFYLSVKYILERNYTIYDNIVTIPIFLSMIAYICIIIASVMYIYIRYNEYIHTNNLKLQKHNNEI